MMETIFLTCPSSNHKFTDDRPITKVIEVVLKKKDKIERKENVMLSSIYPFSHNVSISCLLLVVRMWKHCVVSVTVKRVIVGLFITQS